VSDFNLDKTSLKITRTKRKRSFSATRASIAFLTERGHVAGIVEKWNPHVRIRQDLFGFIDLVVIMPTGEPYFVQTTTGTNAPARREKIRELVKLKPPLAELVRSGRVMLHRWAKRGARGQRKVYTCAEEIVTLSD